MKSADDPVAKLQFRPPDASWYRVPIGGRLDRASTPWLHTNGAGVYACTTIARMHMRRHHGLLVAGLSPESTPQVVVSHVDATIAVIGESGHAQPASELAKHQFPGSHPHEEPFYLESFAQDPLPRWVHRVAGGTFEVSFALVRGQRALVLKYHYVGPHSVEVQLRPLLALRSILDLQREDGSMELRTVMRAGEVIVQPRPDLPPVSFGYSGTFVGSPDWWRRFEYLGEQARGADFSEDLWTPGTFTMRLESDMPRYFVAALGDLPAGKPEQLLTQAADAISREHTTACEATLAAIASAADPRAISDLLRALAWSPIAEPML